MALDPPTASGLDSANLSETPIVQDQLSRRQIILMHWGGAVACAKAELERAIVIVLVGQPNNDLDVFR